METRLHKMFGLCLVIVFASAIPAAAQALSEAKRGVFLVADPKLADHNFKETVVLITHHGPGGTLGIVINRPTDRRLSALLPDLNALKDRTDLLYIGGPVQHGVLVMLVQSREAPAEAQPVTGEIYLSQDLSFLTEIVERGRPGEAFRIYAGYAGWAPGQLQGELNRGDWRIVRVETDAVFRWEFAKTWPEMLRRSNVQIIRGDRFEPSTRIPADYGAGKAFTTPVAETIPSRSPS